MIEAGILDGDIAIIQQAENAENGTIVVALVEDNEVTLKRLRRKGHSIALEPANAKYETRIFGPDRSGCRGASSASCGNTTSARSFRSMGRGNIPRPFSFSITDRDGSPTAARRAVPPRSRPARRPASARSRARRRATGRSGAITRPGPRQRTRRSGTSATTTSASAQSS